MFKKTWAKILGVAGSVVSAVVIGVQSVHAAATDTLITAVGAGLDEGQSSIFDMLSGNMGKIMILFGCLLGIGLLMRLFKRASR